MREHRVTWGGKPPFKIEASRQGLYTQWERLVELGILQMRPSLGNNGRKTVSCYAVLPLNAHSHTPANGVMEYADCGNIVFRPGEAVDVRQALFSGHITLWHRSDKIVTGLYDDGVHVAVHYSLSTASLDDLSVATLLRLIPIDVTYDRFIVRCWITFLVEDTPNFAV